MACGLAWPAAAARAESGERKAEARGSESQPRWDKVKSLLSRGAYREAIEELDAILAVTPNDPLAQAYRRLCERRLRGGGEFERLSPDEMRALQERLRREQAGQKAAAKARERDVQRLIQREQAEWDGQVRRYQEQAKRQEAKDAKARKRQEAERLRMLTRASRDADQEPRPLIPPWLRQLFGYPTPPPKRKPEAPAVHPPPADQPPAESAEPAAQPSQPSSGAAEPDQDRAPLAPDQADAGPAAPGVTPPIPEPADAAPAPVPETDAQPPGPGPDDGAGGEAGPDAVSQAPPDEALEAPEAAEPAAEESDAAGDSSSQLAWPPPATTPDIVEIYADQMTAFPDRQLARAKGHVRVVFEDGMVSADELTLFTDTQDVYAQGHVRLERGLEVFRGEMVHVNARTNKVRALEGTAYREPWYEHGRIVESIAEGVMRVQPGYLTSCEFDPPHFRLQGRDVRVFSQDKLARGRNVRLIVDRLPVLYLPWLSIADRQSPFYLIPGKKKPWEQFTLMGYRYEWPVPGHRGALRMDWRRAFGWGVGVDHRFESADVGNGLVKLYYNEEPNRRRRRSDLPKGADINRYRALARHHWRVTPDTTLVTDYQKFSDIDFQRELLFREEFVENDSPESYVSLTTSNPDFLVATQIKKRVNRFQSSTEELPTTTFSIVPKQIPGTQVFTETTTIFSNIESKTSHSEVDADVVKLDWFQQLTYAMNWFRPIELTPRAAVRQTYYNKDRQGGADRLQGERDLISGQFTAGSDASLKLFRVFPIVSNALGLDINWLRHVVTPTMTYGYTHEPTIDNATLFSPSAGGPSNQVGLSLENKLQTKRRIKDSKLFRSADLVRFITSVPYTFHGRGNREGGQLGEWGFDLELIPWPWLMVETDWSYPSHYTKGVRDERVTGWNIDMVMVGGKGEIRADKAHDVHAPLKRTFEPGPQTGLPLLPQGQWYLGYSHRFSHNARTEEVIEFDWRLSEKWQIGTFHRITWKEVAGGIKRFNHLREVQYTLTRDLHDWIGELVYRVDREFGEELFFTLSLKAYPDLPIELDTSYHQPKIGSQSSPFSPLASEHPKAEAR